MNRRKVLAGTGLSLSTIISGCVSRSTGSRGPPEEITGAECADNLRLAGSKTEDTTWPQIGRDSRNTSYAPGTSGPLDNVKVAWKALGEQSLYPPVIGGDIYLTEQWPDGDAVALNRNEGTIQWTTTDLSPIEWPPALYEDSLLVMTREDSTNQVQLHALNTTSGLEEWEQPTTITASSGQIPPGPTVANDQIYIPSETGVIAIDAPTGNSLWESHLDDKIVEEENGSTRRTSWATPAVTDTTIFTMDLNDGHGDPRKVYALDRETGDLNWTESISLPDDWYFTGYVVVGDDQIFVTALKPVSSGNSDNSEDSSGTLRLVALDADSGKMNWKWDLDGTMVGSPAFAEGVLFIGVSQISNDSSQLHAFDVANHCLLWTYNPDRRTVSTPAVTSEAVYFANSRALVAVSVTDGSPLWRMPFDRSVSAPLVANESVYALLGGRSSSKHVIAIQDK